MAAGPSTKLRAGPSTGLGTGPSAGIGASPSAGPSAGPRASCRIGVDVGGTFTDVALYDETAGAVAVHKVPSVPQDPSQGILDGIAAILEARGLPPTAVAYLAHGTTVATNALLERRGARTALLTTKGFRDLLEIARQRRPDLYRLQIPKPAPLVPRRLRREVDERLLPDGGVLRPLDPDAVEEALATLEREAAATPGAGAAGAPIEALAVCFLHSFVDPAHEELAAKRARARWPDRYISASHEVVPEFREYERLSTTVLNAYLGPLVARYARRFREGTRALGIPCDPYVTQSNGGIISVERAAQTPARTLLSGPSAGVMGAAWVGRLTGHESLITFDMGGTSTDVALVERGIPAVSTEREIEGYPVKVPMLDIHTVGAGGGSIAWVDPGGSLRVGPRSAGARPGPAAYGQGGTEPTVTDANVLLGRLHPTHLLGGRMPLDRAAAEEAVGWLAGILGLSLSEAARGILTVVESNMLRAIRVVSVERGRDPRDFALLAFGGAGPLHAAPLAAELGVDTVLVPPQPGILCALGLLVEDLRTDYVRTRILALEPGVAPTLAAEFAPLESAARAWLEREGIHPAQRLLERQLDMRYAGQNYELPVACGHGAPDAAALRQAFLLAHRQAYGYAAEDEAIQVVNLRVRAVGRVAPLRWAAEVPVHDPDPGPAQIGARDVYFDEAGGFVETPLYARDRLRAGHRMAGPAIIEQMDSTTVLPPGHTAHVHPSGTLAISVPPR